MNAERVTAILEVLCGPDGVVSLSPGRIGVLAGFPRTKRLDTGVRTTLMAMERRGLVDWYRHGEQWSGDYWFATEAGKAALEADKAQVRRGSGQAVDGSTTLPPSDQVGPRRKGRR